METKVCKKCGRELLISEFYVHKQMSDGHLSFCKECVKTRVRKYRDDNIDEIKEKDKKRHSLIFLNTEKEKNSYKNHQRSKYNWAKRNRLKRNAHTQLKRAIDNGLILKQNKCEVCGKSNCEIQAHHYNYSKPLDVIWLCTECHGKVHRQYNKLELDIEQIKKNREENQEVVRECL